MAKKLAYKYSQTTVNTVYFNGCDTKEKVDARYKQLCKVLHPDSIGGDKESFQKMKEEYEKIRMEL